MVTTAGAVCSTTGAYESPPAPIVRAAAVSGAIAAALVGAAATLPTPDPAAVQPTSDPVKRSAAAAAPILARNAVRLFGGWLMMSLELIGGVSSFDESLGKVTASRIGPTDYGLMSSALHR